MRTAKKSPKSAAPKKRAEPMKLAEGGTKKQPIGYPMPTGGVRGRSA